MAKTLWLWSKLLSTEYGRTLWSTNAQTISCSLFGCAQRGVTNVGCNRNFWRHLLYGNAGFPASILCKKTEGRKICNSWSFGHYRVPLPGAGKQSFRLYHTALFSVFSHTGKSPEKAKGLFLKKCKIFRSVFIFIHVNLLKNFSKVIHLY